MSPHRILSFIFLIVTIGVVSGSPCTPATCLNGPVTVSFASPDCSGSGTLSDLYPDDPSTYGTCQMESVTSSYRIDVTSQFVAHSEVNNAICDLTRSNATYSIQQHIFGKCIPHKDGSSSMILANANATYTSPQPAPVVNLNRPDLNLDAYRARCQTVNDCTDVQNNNPLYISYHVSDDDCYPVVAQGTYNNSYDGKTCYRLGELHYVTTHCIDEHAYARRYYLDSDCQNMFSADYERRFCSTTHYSCLAAPIPLDIFSTPPTTSAPTSSATTALPTFLLLLNIIALLF